MESAYRASYNMQNYKIKGTQVGICEHFRYLKQTRTVTVKITNLWFHRWEKTRITDVCSWTTTSPRAFQRSQDDVNCKYFKPRGLDLTLSHWWKVIWIIKSFKKLDKVIYTVYSNIIYALFLSKTKPKLVILSPSCCLRSLLSKKKTEYVLTNSEDWQLFFPESSVLTIM